MGESEVLMFVGMRARGRGGRRGMVVVVVVGWRVEEMSPLAGETGLVPAFDEPGDELFADGLDLGILVEEVKDRVFEDVDVRVEELCRQAEGRESGFVFVKEVRRVEGSVRHALESGSRK
jgi:hypothetical protein